MPTKTKETSRPRQAATPAAAGATGMPVLIPEQLVTFPPTETVVAGAPALQPPGVESAGVAAQAPAAVTATSATIGGLWTSNAQSNSWAYLNGIGWRRISAANAGAHHAMLQLARLAKDANVQVQCEEDGSVIHAIYVW